MPAAFIRSSILRWAVALLLVFGSLYIWRKPYLQQPLRSKDSPAVESQAHQNQLVSQPRPGANDKISEYDPVFFVGLARAIAYSNTSQESAGTFIPRIQDHLQWAYLSDISTLSQLQQPPMETEVEGHARFLPRSKRRQCK